MDAHSIDNTEATSEHFWKELHFQNEIPIKSSLCNYFNNGVDLETIYENCASFNGDNGSEFWVAMSNCVKEPKNKHIDQDNIDQGKKLEMEKEGKTGLSMEKISKFFHLPIDEAATELGIGVVTLRNKRQKLGFQRWPNRKLNSLQRTINNIQILSKQGLMNNEQANDTIKMVKEKIALINRFPDTPLGKNIVKLRQFCFKINNRMKKKEKTN